MHYIVNRLLKKDFEQTDTDLPRMAALCVVMFLIVSLLVQRPPLLPLVSPDHERFLGFERGLFINRHQVIF